MELFALMGQLLLAIVAIGLIVGIIEAFKQKSFHKPWRELLGLPAVVFTKTPTRRHRDSFNRLIITGGRMHMNESELCITMSASTGPWYARHVTGLTILTLRRLLVGMWATARDAMNRLGITAFGATQAGRRSMALAN